MSASLADVLRDRGLSGRAAREAAQTGKVRLLGVPCSDLGRSVEPTEVTLHPSAPRMVVGRDPFVLHRDPDLAVVVKPAGMLSVPAPGRREPDVIGFVRKLFGTAFPVHRLDEETSGLMMVALTARAQDALKRLLEVHAVDRRYQAIVDGVFPSAQTVDSVLVRNRGDGLRGSGEGHRDADEGKRAITHFRRLESLRGASRVEARLETGRTHQVRIHAAESGHAILGDPLYASAAIQRRSPRLALHAYRLELVHPFGGPLHWEIPLPDDLEALRVRLSGPPSHAGSPPPRRAR